MTHAPTDDDLWNEIDAFRAECEALLATLGPDDDEDRESLTALLRKVKGQQQRAEDLKQLAQHQDRLIAEMRVGNAALNARIKWKEAQLAGRGEPLLKVIKPIDGLRT